MHFAVLFEDDESHADQRPLHMAAHLAFLDKHGDVIRAAGPLRDAGAGNRRPVEAADAAAVQALVEPDPFWPTGLRESVRVLEWKRVFADGKRLL